MEKPHNVLKLFFYGTKLSTKFCVHNCVQHATSGTNRMTVFLVVRYLLVKIFGVFVFQTSETMREIEGSLTLRRLKGCSPELPMATRQTLVSLTRRRRRKDIQIILGVCNYSDPYFFPPFSFTIQCLPYFPFSCLCAV